VRHLQFVGQGLQPVKAAGGQHHIDPIGSETAGEGHPDTRRRPDDNGPGPVTFCEILHHRFPCSTGNQTVGDEGEVPIPRLGDRHLPPGGARSLP